MVKRIVIVVAALLVLAGVGGGAFYAGMQYQQSLAAAVQNRFFSDRGGPNGGAFLGGTPPAGVAPGAGFVGGAGGRGTVGEIKSIDGSVLTLSTPQSEVKVTLTDSTLIEKLVAGAAADLQVGQRVSVRGETDSAGNVTAASLQITAAAPAQP